MKTALIILDGWGLGNADGNNAIEVAQTPYVDRLNAHTPHATLRTDGEHVGLPDGQMGNSEVGLSETEFIPKPKTCQKLA